MGDQDVARHLIHSEDDDEEHEAQDSCTIRLAILSMILKFLFSKVLKIDGMAGINYGTGHFNLSVFRDCYLFWPIIFPINHNQLSFFYQLR